MNRGPGPHDLDRTVPDPENSFQKKCKHIYLYHIHIISGYLDYIFKINVKYRSLYTSLSYFTHIPENILLYDDIILFFEHLLLSNA